MIKELYNEFTSQLTTNQFLSAGVFVSIIVGLSKYVKDFFIWIYRRIKRKILYTTRIDQSSQLWFWLSDFLHHKHVHKLRNTDAYLSYKDNRTKIHYSPNVDTFFIRLGFKFILIKASEVKMETSLNEQGDLFFRYCTFYSFFGKKVVDNFLNNLFHYSEGIRQNPLIKKFDAYGDIRNLTDSAKKTFSNIYIPEETKKEIIRTIDSFLCSKDKYVKNNISHRKGLLFYGLPGTGKSSVVEAIASHFDMDIYIMDLSVLNSNHYLEKAFSKVPPKSIILFEDIDAHFDGRNMNNKHLNFSSFINILSGLGSKEDSLVIFTTNYIERLDSALIRDGRMDLKLEIKHPVISLVEKYLSDFYEKEIILNCDDKDEMLPISMAKVENMCVSNIDSPDIVIEMIHDILNNKEV